MKQICLNCDKTFYPTENNRNGYPYDSGSWSSEEQRYIRGDNHLTQRGFHSRGGMEEFLSKHTDVLTPIYKQLKEREGNNARSRKDQTELAQATST